METSSITMRSPSRGWRSFRRNCPVRGSTSSRRWIVLASIPVLSVSRLAARPVGAHSRGFTAFAHSTRRMALSSVVLPTPGPTGDDEHLAGQREPHRFALLLGQCEVQALLHPRERLLRVDALPRRGARGEGGEARSDALLGRVQPREEDDRRPVDGVRHQRTVGQLERQCFPDQRVRHAEELRRPRGRALRVAAPHSPRRAPAGARAPARREPGSSRWARCPASSRCGPP